MHPSARGARDPAERQALPARVRKPCPEIMAWLDTSSGQSGCTLLVALHVSLACSYAVTRYEDLAGRRHDCGRTLSGHAFKVGSALGVATLAC